jgi:16S rRNA (cytosine967-C5)-methyltransferase
MPKQPGVEARAAAARAVDAVLSNRGNLDQALSTSELAGRDRALCRALAFGALRTHERNRWLLSQLLDKPMRKRERVIEALLSVALFALTESERPDYAVVSVSVDAAKALGQPRLSGLVNAILRRFLRERETLLAKAQEHEPARWQHPQWLIDAIRQDWPDDWQRILKAANEQPPMWLRVNQQKLSRAAWLAKLPPGMETAAVPDAPAHAVCLTEPVSVDDLPGFAAGEVSVQDAAAQFAADLLAPAAGMTILDACAAPGGKTCHLLESTPQAGELVALDVSAKRLMRVTENLARLGLAATVVTGDLLSPADWAGARRFDRILLDAPCSATGVIRRHPDIRFLRKPEGIAEFAATQLKMLQAAWSLLKPGGRLLYATCSLLRAENEVVINGFLTVTPTATACDPGSEVLARTAVQAGSGWQLLPGAAATDGFYYALMQKAS